ASDIRKAGTSQLTSDGRKRVKNSKKETIPFCQTMSVVMSPKGLKAPPASVATTILMHATAINPAGPAPTAIATAPSTSHVVRLSATGDMKKAIVPVIQYSVRRE